MKSTIALLCVFAGLALGQEPHATTQSTIALPSSTPTVQATQNRIAREVLHELLMLPYYSVFDDLSFSIDPSHNVTLIGDVVNPATKIDAGTSVKGVDGVESVKNQIQVLPPSPQDQQIRVAEYRSIYGYDGLSKYSWSTVPSIHIIVKGGHVQLIGVVDSDTDKNMAGIRANSVPGVFSVRNDLRVANQTAMKSK